MACKIEITTSDGEKTIFFASGLAYTVNREYSEVAILGKYAPEELVPGIMTINMTCSGVRFFGEPVKKNPDELIAGGICTAHSMAIKALSRKQDAVKPKHKPRRRSTGRRNRSNNRV